MTEEEARELLRLCDGLGGLEAWIAGRRWQAVPGGWTIKAELQGWRFRLEPVAGGVRIQADMPGGDPAVWTVGDRATGLGGGETAARRGRPP